MSSCRAVGSGCQDMVVDGFARDDYQKAGSCGIDRNEAKSDVPLELGPG